MKPRLIAAARPFLVIHLTVRYIYLLYYFRGLNVDFFDEPISAPTASCLRTATGIRQHHHQWCQPIYHLSTHHHPMGRSQLGETCLLHPYDGIQSYRSLREGFSALSSTNQTAQYRSMLYCFCSVFVPNMRVFNIYSACDRLGATCLLHPFLTCIYRSLRERFLASLTTIIRQPLGAAAAAAVFQSCSISQEFSTFSLLFTHRIIR